MFWTGGAVIYQTNVHPVSNMVPSPLSAFRILSYRDLVTVTAITLYKTVYGGKTTTTYQSWNANLGS